MYETLRVSTTLYSLFTSFSFLEREILFLEMIHLVFAKKCLAVYQKVLFVIIWLDVILDTLLHAFLSSFYTFVTLSPLRLPISVCWVFYIYISRFASLKYLFFKLFLNGKLLPRIIFVTVCYYHVTYEFQSESKPYSLLECQGTPCSKQVLYLNPKWQQRHSNPQPLSS